MDAEDAVNLNTPVIYNTICDGNYERQVENAEGTEAARDTQQKIKERFKGWIWQDDT